MEVLLKLAKKEEKIVPLLPLRGLLVYPTMVLHLDVGREKSVQALEKAMMDDHIIFLTTQRDISIDEPAEEDIFKVGTLTKIKQMLKLPNGTIRVLVEGMQRGEMTKYTDEGDYFSVSALPLDERDGKDAEDEALMRTLLDHFDQYIKLSKKSPEKRSRPFLILMNPEEWLTSLLLTCRLSSKKSRKCLKPWTLKSG